MELLPIKMTLAENREFTMHPVCQESIYMCVAFYEKAGFDPPWIGYYARLDGKLVGSAAFKGKPHAGKVEIAYGTFPQYRYQGVGTEICRLLVQLSLQTDPAIRITARTLPENNESGSILRKNGFKLLGTIWDEEDGNVWEWEFTKSHTPHLE